MKNLSFNEQNKYYTKDGKLVRDVYTQTFNPRLSRRNAAVQTGNPEEGIVVIVHRIPQQQQHSNNYNNNYQNDHQNHHSSQTSFHQRVHSNSLSSPLDISLVSQTDRFYLVTIPLNKPEFIQRFMSLKTSVVNSTKFDGSVYESLFCNAKTLHLTIALLNITTRAQAEQAKEVLKKEFRKIRNFSFNLDIHGLKVWNDEEYACRTVCIRLFNKHLQKIVNRISATFQDNNMLKGVKSYGSPRTIPLHVTIMNTKRFGYRSADCLNTFDARPIIQHYGNWSFPNVVLDDIQFNFSGFVNLDGYYYCEYSYRDDYCSKSTLVEEIRDQLKMMLKIP